MAGSLVTQFPQVDWVCNPKQERVVHQVGRLLDDALDPVLDLRESYAAAETSDGEDIEVARPLYHRRSLLTAIDPLTVYQDGQQLGHGMIGASLGERLDRRESPSVVWMLGAAGPLQCAIGP